MPIKFPALWTALLLCIGVHAQAPTSMISELLKEPDFSPGPLRKIDGLNSAQQKAVEDYIRRAERRNGDLRILVDRNQIVPRSSEALHRLFPDDRFVAVTSVYQATTEAAKKYSIPGPLTYTLALDQNGNDIMPQRSGYLEEYGALLRSRGIKVDDAASAALVRSALQEIYGFALSGEDSCRSESHWYLGYHEHAWRPISSYEEIREASYYVLTTNAEGAVTSGRLVNEVLERRKMSMPSAIVPSAAH
jgi:hypothetical protein